jgi:hypothetical protein
MFSVRSGSIAEGRMPCSSGYISKSKSCNSPTVARKSASAAGDLLPSDTSLPTVTYDAVQSIIFMSGLRSGDAGGGGGRR